MDCMQHPSQQLHGNPSNSVIVSMYILMYRSESHVTMSLQYPINVYESVLADHRAKRIKNIADLSYTFAWPLLIEEIKLDLPLDRSLVNVCRLRREGPDSEPPKLYTPLHQAATGRASIEVFKELLELGASKTLKTAQGETAYDIGVRKNLDPEILKLIEVPEEIRKRESEIKLMEEGLHKAILGRSEDLIKKSGQQLPQLAYLYEFGSFWYPIPGMYGGFNIEATDEGVETSSWCRVVGGSGERHVIDKEGNVTLAESGFC
ncbi:hypothetical protein FSP39_019819 [Pinctada imbricata]|uniref:Uncharacterized protein n=1 Tax=Pinctada imbricata TaxID=66713 RepID=A0AA88Y2G8_PINIB|nr:hypothetical protein FSP39_019819 [Pinctada imbricata]